MTNTEQNQERKNELDSFLKNIQNQNIFSIKEAIEDITAYLQKRADVHKDITGHVEKVKTMINNFIMELSNQEPDQKLLLELRKKLIEMEEIIVQEKLNYFRDTADLKKELRETMQEYREKESKANMIEDLFKK